MPSQRLTTMRIPFTAEIVVPLWIMGVGIVATFAPTPGALAGAFLLLVSVVVVPILITRLFRTRPA